MASIVRVIGVGNAMRRDDGAGPAVVRLLERMKPGPIQLRIESGEGASLMEAWDGADVVFVVDAVSHGNAPGSIHRFDACTDRLPSGFFHYSTHAFSVAEAVELARALGRMPDRLVVFGVEGEDFGSGEGLSQVVAAAVERTAAAIAAELRQIAGHGDPGSAP